MALYKLLLILVMHHTVFEITDATQCPELTKAQLEGRPCHCYIIVMFLLAISESFVLISPTCTCILSHAKMPQL